LSAITNIKRRYNFSNLNVSPHSAKLLLNTVRPTLYFVSCLSFSLLSGCREARNCLREIVRLPVVAVGMSPAQWSLLAEAFGKWQALGACRTIKDSTAHAPCACHFEPARTLIAACCAKLSSVEKLPAGRRILDAVTRFLLAGMRTLRSVRRFLMAVKRILVAGSSFFMAGLRILAAGRSFFTAVTGILNAITRILGDVGSSLVATSSFLRFFLRFSWEYLFKR